MSCQKLLSSPSRAVALPPRARCGRCVLHRVWSGQTVERAVEGNFFFEVLQGQGLTAISSQPPQPLPWLLSAVGHLSVASPSNHKALG